MAKIREITSGFRAPEGPVALKDGSVLVVELKGGALTRVAPDGKKEVVAEVEGAPQRRCYRARWQGLYLQ